MLSYMLLLFYFYPDTDLLSGLMAPVCCQANFLIAWVKLMLPLRQLTFQKRVKQLLCLQKGREEERETFVSGIDFSCKF